MNWFGHPRRVGGTRDGEDQHLASRFLHATGLDGCPAEPLAQGGRGGELAQVTQLRDENAISDQNFAFLAESLYYILPPLSSVSAQRG